MESPTNKNLDQSELPEIIHVTDDECIVQTPPAGFLIPRNAL